MAPPLTQHQPAPSQNQPPPGTDPAFPVACAAPWRGSDAKRPPRGRPPAAFELTSRTRLSCYSVNFAFGDRLTRHFKADASACDSDDAAEGSGVEVVDETADGEVVEIGPRPDASDIGTQ